MLCELLLARIASAPRPALDGIAAAIWAALHRDELSEASASSLLEAVQARRSAAPSAPAARTRRPPRPATPASVGRRRWRSGLLPARVSELLTEGERAVLAVIGDEVRRRGACTLHRGAIAAKAGVCERLVRRALAAARALGLLEVEARRLSAWRQLPNRVVIRCAAWLAWLRGRRADKGERLFPRPNTVLENPSPPPLAAASAVPLAASRPSMGERLRL